MSVLVQRDDLRIVLDNIAGYGGYGDLREFEAAYQRLSDAVDGRSGVRLIDVDDPQVRERIEYAVCNALDNITSEYGEREVGYLMDDILAALKEGNR